jgi:hypothetical protein
MNRSINPPALRQEARKTLEKEEKTRKAAGLQT